MASALTASLARDGQTIPTANLPMGGFRHTGVSDGVLRTDYAALGQVQNGAFLWGGTAGGTADAITISLSPSITAYAAGQVFRFISSAANTGAVTLNINGVGAVAINKGSGSVALAANDIQASTIISVQYDGTQFRLLASGDFIETGSGTVFRTVQNKIREAPLSVTDFGAVGDNTTPCDAAFAACFSAAKAQRRPWHIPKGTYLFTTTATTFWDMAGSEFFGMKITGDGAGNTILRFPNVTTNIGLQIYAASDWYDFAMSDLQFQFQTATAGMVLGQNSFVDPLNTPNLTNIIILNTLDNSATEGLRLNYVVNGLFNNVRANCYASASGGVLTAVNGTGLRCRQVGFCTFNNGSYGNGTYGVQFTDTFNFGNVWVGTDFENVEYCVRGNASATGNNSFLGGQFANYMRAALSNTGGLNTGAFITINPNFNNPPAWAVPGTNPLGVAATVIDQINFGGIRLIDGTPVTTPAVPATGVAAANISGKRLLVTIWAGTVTNVNVNGFNFAISSGSVVLPHAQTITLTYTGTPNWFWQPLE